MKTISPLFVQFCAITGMLAPNAYAQTENLPVKMHAFSNVTELSRPQNVYETMQKCKDEAEKHFKNASVVSCTNTQTGENEIASVLIKDGNRVFFWAQKVNPEMPKPSSR